MPHRAPRLAGTRRHSFGASIVALFALAACPLGEPIARQAIDYNVTVEQAANTLLVRNILRARDEAPLHFTTLPRIRGSVNLGTGQPGIGVPVGGGSATPYVLSLGTAGGVSPSFDVSRGRADACGRGDCARGMASRGGGRDWWSRPGPPGLSR